MNRELASPEPLHSEKTRTRGNLPHFSPFLQSFRLLLNSSTTKSPAKRGWRTLAGWLLQHYLDRSLQFGTAAHYQVVFAEKESGGAAVCFSVTRSCTSSTSSSMYLSLHSLLQNAISPLHPQETSSFVRNHELN
jgi:hypothetical protein